MNEDAAEALWRILWRFVADLDSCCCIHGIDCDLCQATKALGLGPWSGPVTMSERLREWRKQHARDDSAYDDH